ncbi:MAG: methylenetetrahydrofolate reductase, partial [Candidatus Nanopelagicales bacterium]|nr:methylenetetrahydrofolate reductase [Candidatus Nanopelagicales bacterium]
WTSTPGGLEHADELVELVNRLGRFSVGVAAFPDIHPSSPSLAFDVQVLKGKQDRGADFAMTQFFFDVDSYLRYVDAAAAAGVTMPIIPGIMPVTDVRQLQRFAMLSGTPLPDALTQRFEAVADDPDAVVELGVEVAAQMCSRLLSEGAPGLHFYTLNRSFSTLRVYREDRCPGCGCPRTRSPSWGCSSRSAFPICRIASGTCGPESWHWPLASWTTSTVPSPS